MHSVDPDAAWYRREPDQRDDYRQGAAGSGKIAWGFEATLAVSGPDQPDADQVFPNLVVAMAVLHQPGHDVGHNGTEALASLSERGYPAHYLAADRAYSSAKAEDFQLAALAFGYRPVYDYKIDQLGVKASAQGFLQIEGAWYCPSIPTPVIDATLDYREGRIDEATYRARLEERWRYRARPKSNLDAEGHGRFQCPAANPWPLARCDLKPTSVRSETAGRLRITVRSDVGAKPPPSCSQQSVTIPPEAGAKFAQALLYGSAEWQATYNLLRNTNEGMNGYLKDPAHEALDDPGRRRIHGVAAQSVLVAFLILAANVRKIRSFLLVTRTGPGTAQRRSRRRRTRSIENWRPQSPSVPVATGPDPPLIA